MSWLDSLPGPESAYPHKGAEREAEAGFRASGVQIRRVYIVSCSACACDLDDGGGEGLATRQEAEDARKAHIDEVHGGWTR